MSGSPKHCQASLRAEQERRLREERERKEAEERQRRRQEEERQRLKRLEEVRREASDECSALRGRLAAFEVRDAARFVAPQLEEVRQKVTRLTAEIAAGQNEATVRQKRAQLAEAEDQLRQVVAQGEAEKMAAALSREEAALTLVKQLISAHDSHRSLKFDTAGHREIKATILRAEQALRAGLPAEAGRIIAEARGQLDRHGKTVDQKFHEWSQQQQQALLRFAEAQDCLAGLAVDPLVNRWQGKQLAALRQAGERLQTPLEAEQFTTVQEESRRIVQQVSELVGTAQEMQLKEDRRNYIVDGILQIMQQMGFVAQQSSPCLEYADYPESAKIIRAQRIAGGTIAVSVPQDGEIWYAVDGFPMRVETSSDGRTASSCDEAQSQIENLHQALDDAFGIQTSELMWAGKDPTRVQKRAERLPDHASSSVGTAQSRSRTT